MLSFWQRLKSRALVRWATAYLAAAWVILQAASLLAENFAWPVWIVRSLTVLLGVGFLGTLVLAWYHGERGKQRVTGPEMAILAGVVLLGAASLALVPGETRSDSAIGSVYSPPAERGSIAVLPFVNMSEDVGNEYFSDGITDELIHALANVPGLRVAARTSSFELKGQERSVQEIAATLRVARLLEGSVRRLGEDVRITAQLIDPTTGYHLWSETFSRRLTDVFAIQEEIAREIARQLQIELAAETDRRLVRRRTSDPEAFTLYLKGRHLWHERTEEGILRSIDFFQQAIARDSGYAAAYSGLADAYLTAFDYELLPPAEATRLGREAAERALAVEDRLPEAHTSLAHIHLHDWQWAEAERAFRRALELDPSYAPAHHWYALNLTAVGRLDEAVAVMERAQELDPLSQRIAIDVGMAYHAARRYDDAIAQEHRVLEMNSRSGAAHWITGMAYEQKGELQEAIRHFRESMEAAPGNAVRLAALAHAQARAGDREAARKVVAELEERAAAEGGLPFLIALVHTGLGEKEAALAWLEKAVEQRSGSVRYLKVEPRLDPLRSDPRFQTLLRRVGLPL